MNTFQASTGTEEVWTHRARRFPESPLRAVAYDLSEPAPVLLWHGAAGVTEYPFTVTRLTVNEARGLAAGLLAAVDAVAAALPDRCPSCDEPTLNDSETGVYCALCCSAARSEARRLRRSRLSIVESSDRTVQNASA